MVRSALNIGTTTPTVALSEIIGTLFSPQGLKNYAGMVVGTALVKDRGEFAAKPPVH